MALPSGEIEPISTVPDEELFSYYQLDIPAFHRAMIQKPTLEALDALLAHRYTMRCWDTNADLVIKQAHDVALEAQRNYEKTAQILAKTCGSTASPCPTKSPPIAGEVLRTIMERQAVYVEGKVSLLDDCRREKAKAGSMLYMVERKVQDMEDALGLRPR